MIHVYLDDLRPCPKGFVLARNTDECIQLLKHENIHILSLDHDLGWGQPTGYDLVKYMTEHQLYAKEIYLHTSSLSGKVNMYERLLEHKPDEVKLYDTPIPVERLMQIGQDDIS